MKDYIIVIMVILTALIQLTSCSQSKHSIADEIEGIIEEKGIEAAVERYRELKSKSPEGYDFALNQLRDLALKLFSDGRTEQAIQIAELNAESFPESANVYYDLAKAYHYVGKWSKSKENIQKSFELDSLSLQSVILRKKIFFVPEDFSVPLLLETDAFHLRPLKASDVELDYQAVMSSLDHLKGVFGPGSRWPSKNLTKEEDLKALQWHEKEFKRREGFVYTLLNHQETECLGCVYIYPSKLDTCDAQVVMWVTGDAFKQGFDSILFQTVKKWMKEKWSFKKVVYPGREVEWSDFSHQLGEQDKKYH